MNILEKINIRKLFMDVINMKPETNKIEDSYISSLDSDVEGEETQKLEYSSIKIKDKSLNSLWVYLNEFCASIFDFYKAVKRADEGLEQQKKSLTKKVSINSSQYEDYSVAS